VRGVVSALGSLEDGNGGHVSLPPGLIKSRSNTLDSGAVGKRSGGEGGRAAGRSTSEGRGRGHRLRRGERRSRGSHGASSSRGSNAVRGTSSSLGSLEDPHGSHVSLPPGLLEGRSDTLDSSAVGEVGAHVSGRARGEAGRVGAGASVDGVSVDARSLLKKLDGSEVATLLSHLDSRSNALDSSAVREGTRKGGLGAHGARALDRDTAGSGAEGGRAEGGGGAGSGGSGDAVGGVVASLSGFELADGAHVSLSPGHLKSRSDALHSGAVRKVVHGGDGGAAGGVGSGPEAEASRVSSPGSGGSSNTVRGRSSATKGSLKSGHGSHVSLSPGLLKSRSDTLDSSAVWKGSRRGDRSRGRTGRSSSEGRSRGGGAEGRSGGSRAGRGRAEGGGGAERRGSSWARSGSRASSGRGSYTVRGRSSATKGSLKSGHGSHVSLSPGLLKSRSDTLDSSAVWKGSRRGDRSRGRTGRSSSEGRSRGGRAERRGGSRRAGRSRGASSSGSSYTVRRGSASLGSLKDLNGTSISVPPGLLKSRPNTLDSGAVRQRSSVLGGGGRGRASSRGRAERRRSRSGSGRRRVRVGRRAGSRRGAGTSGRGDSVRGASTTLSGFKDLHGGHVSLSPGLLKSRSDTLDSSAVWKGSRRGDRSRGRTGRSSSEGRSRGLRSGPKGRGRSERRGGSSWARSSSRASSSRGSYTVRGRSSATKGSLKSGHGSHVSLSPGLLKSRSDTLDSSAVWKGSRRGDRSRGRTGRSSSEGRSRGSRAGRSRAERR